jgi:hypothetical protein
MENTIAVPATKCAVFLRKDVAALVVQHGVWFA